MDDSNKFGNGKIMRLDLGCGRSKREGFTGVDTLNLPGVDIVHDLNVFPYPFENGVVGEIWMDQVLEHLNEPMKVVEELWRICRNGAVLHVGVPYFRSFYATIDPTHRNFFGTQWFNYFDPRHSLCQKYSYSGATFLVKGIEFDREFKSARISFFHRLLISLAEKHPNSYEARLSHLFPLNSLTFHLHVVKPTC